MKIVILSDWFSENMGYIENCLPKALSLLGHEVHVVTSERQVYSNSPNYPLIYQSFLGPPEVQTGITSANGFSLHRLPSKRKKGTLRISYLKEYISELNPDIIQSLDLSNHASYVCAVYCWRKKIPIFTTNHSTKSSFPLAVNTFANRLKRIKWFYRRWIPGRVTSLISELSYPPTTDCEEIAIKFKGLQSKKSKICPLGVDTQTFCPVMKKDKHSLDEFRSKLGFSKDEFVCAYTGRLSEAKNPLLLATAVAELNETGTTKFKSLFIGDGPQKAEIERIESSTVFPFVAFPNLPQYYWLSTIAVWPKQESTSMLDAAACGVPIIVSDKVQATERFHGNGLTYKEGSVASLKESILKMRDEDFRSKLGKIGSKKMRDNFSWTKIAKDREKDYQQALNKLSK